MNYKPLIEEAVKAKANALPPYSNFHVGAALLTKDNKVYRGCNVETSSYSLTICAERNAIFSAVADGKRKFEAIAVAADTDDFISPCGACRQVINDICGEIDIIMINNKNEYTVKKTSELLPFAFTGESLKK